VNPVQDATGVDGFLRASLGAGQGVFLGAGDMDVFPAAVDPGWRFIGATTASERSRVRTRSTDGANRATLH
jgi:hypothetical protein